MKAMILAAGLGTRLKPFTDNHPKALAVVNGKTLLQRNVEFLRSHGANEIIINVHHFAEQIIALINDNRNTWADNITISDESDEVLETGGGVKKAAAFLSEVDEPFILMNADILTDMDLTAMIAEHKKSSPVATLAVSTRTSGRYFLFDGKSRLCGWENEKTGERKGEAGTRKAFSGIHIISPLIFNLMTETGKFSMTDLYLRLCRENVIMGFDHTGFKFIDVGKPESIAAAEELFA